MHNHHLFLLLILLPFHKGWLAQDSSRVQLGFYGGAGITIVDENIKPFLYYDGGLSVIFHTKKKPKLRGEVFVQFSEHSYNRSSNTGLYYIDDHTTAPSFVESKYKVQLIIGGFKWHLPIVYKPQFRLYFAPGISFGSLLEYSYIRTWYDNSSKNNIYKSYKSEIYPTVRLLFGPVISFKSEFKLTTRMFFHTNLSFTASILPDYNSSGMWIGVSLQPGLYWYL
jgi:hypothetical protein